MYARFVVDSQGVAVDTRPRCARGGLIAGSATTDTPPLWMHDCDYTVRAIAKLLSPSHTH